MPKNVDLGFYNGDYPAWGLEKEFESFEVESRYFPSKVHYYVLLGSSPLYASRDTRGKGGTFHLKF